MSQDFTSTEVSYQLSIYDGSPGGNQVLVCLGNTFNGPWNQPVQGAIADWTDANAKAFITAVVAAYHQYAPADSAPQIALSRFGMTNDQVMYTVDPVTGAVS